MMNDDMELVREYAARQSEQAFETLVSRNVGLVHSAALRQLRDPHLAEEITQTVFIILARKAGSLNPKTILPGWLYRTTRYVSAAALKIQRRRERREQEAHMEAVMQDNQTDPAWEQFSPLLDEAMANLRDKDRDAIVLRFFQNRSLRDVGAALGVDEYAAQKRVARALEKIRTFLVKHGIDSTAETIAVAISTHSIQATPALLAKAVAAVAVAKGAAASGSTLTLIKGVLKIMAWTKAKTAVVIGITVILAAGTTTTLVVRHHGQDIILIDGSRMHVNKRDGDSFEGARMVATNSSGQQQMILAADNGTIVENASSHTESIILTNVTIDQSGKGRLTAHELTITLDQSGKTQITSDQIQMTRPRP
jgi:RNA polymerase sigma factor (sigma-70 family)